MTMSSSFQDQLEYVKGLFLYKIFNKKISPVLPKSVKVEYHEDKKKGTILISSPDYLGLQTVIKKSDSEEKVIQIVNDAIFTYFGIPRYISLHTKNLFLPLKLKGNKKEFAIA